MASGDERDTSVPTGQTGSTTSSVTTGETSIETSVLRTSMGSGLLAQQPTPQADEHVTVAKVCPQCGGEYETGDRFCPKDGAALRPKGGGDPLIGRVIADRYLILARLGEGGMGRVYVAEHVKMNRQCALKVMNPSLMNDAESMTRFAREASNAARILHPNVAAVFDFGESEKIVYLVMEYIDGESLSALLDREGTLDPRRAVDIARQIADGLSAAHELGIIHRDLKPDNVIIAQRRDGREVAKVVDFGIAKALSDSPQDALTRSGLVIGTPEYMSPEQLLGDPVDARVDIYALGCMLYQMLTGAQPFAAETREQMIRRRLHEPPPHVREAIPEIPRRLDTLLAHLLARAPGDRMASAAEASAALDPALTLAGWETPAESRGPVKSPRGAPTVIRPSADPAMQPTIPMKRQTSSAKRLWVGLVAVSIAALAIVPFWPRDDTPGPVATGAQNATPAAGGAGAPSPVTTSTPAATLPATPTNAPAPNGAASAPAVNAPATNPSAPNASPAGATTAAAASKRGASGPSGATRPDSTAKASSPSEKTAAPNDDVAMIRQKLEHFAVVVANGEVPLLREYPTMSPSVLDGLRKIYAVAENVRARSTLGTITMSGDKAVVPFTVPVTYQFRDSKQPGSFRFELRATFAKRSGKWDLATVERRQ